MPSVSGARKAFFDVWSRFYDVPAVQLAVYRPVHEAVMAELRARPAPTVLDVGCGTGILTDRLRGVAGTGLVVGCDFSAGMLTQAVARARDGHWVRADALHLPLPDRAVDAVVSTESFHWFPDQGAALAEFRRVLVPGGRLLVALVNPRLPVTSRVAHASSQLVGEPAYWPTREELRELLRDAGFDVRRQRRILRVAGIVLPTVLTVATA